MLSMTACATVEVDYVEERQSDQTMTAENCLSRGGKLETREDGVRVCKIVEEEHSYQDGSFSNISVTDIIMGVFVIAAVAVASGGGGGDGFTDDDL